MKQAFFNWSGGKDSSLALFKIQQDNTYQVARLLTTVNSVYQRISMHGVRIEMLEKQAECLGIELQKLLLPEQPTMEEYSQIMEDTLYKIREEGFTESIFGDIFLEDLRKYREEQLAKIPMNAVFPIWAGDTTQLVHEFIDLGFKAVVVCINGKHLNSSFVGRELDKTFIQDLPPDVDPCGENGEFHSFVYDGPIFKQPVHFERGEIVHRSYKTDDTQCGRSSDSQQVATATHDTEFWYCDLKLVE